MRRWFCLAIAILLVCGLAGCLKPQPDSKPETATTVILIRHAERDNFFNLTDLGRKHAAALVDAVGDMGIAAIYSPNLERCLDTVKPLANHLGINITLTPRISKEKADEIIRKMLSAHAGQSLLLVAHGSGNLSALHQRLGGTGDGPYRYGDLYIYTIPVHGTATVVKTRY